MRKITILFIGLTFFSSCSAHKSTVSNRLVKENNQRVQRDNSPPPGGYTPITSLQYIDRYKDIAIREMNLYGVPASITLAQGLFESGSGNGDLARSANNHFGIKVTPGWDGKVYYKDDDEKNDAFRVYASPEESFRDHSLFLKRKNYTSLFTLDITDYKGWAYGLKRAGYATNPNYPSLLISIIEKYNLGQYDTKGGMIEIKKRDTVILVPATNNPVAVRDTIVQAPAVNKTYTVKQGDTLYGLSKRFGLTVDDLKTLNNLNSNSLQIGQVLVVVKP
jgi:flagellum-specific peptidoglycan hydrolase FlgJ